MDAEVIKEFLARLGFEIDEAGAQKFTNWLGMATARTAAFGAGITAAAAGLYYGVYKIAQSNSELLGTAEALGMSVQRLRELNFVAEQQGSNAEAVKSSLESLKSAMAGATIGQGGLATFARLGIRIKDNTGKLRDTADVLDEVGRKIQKMDRPRAEMFMGQLGIDRSLYRMLTQDVTGLTAAYRDMYAATGMDAQKAAEQSREFVKEVKMLKTVFGLLAETVGLALIGKAGKDVRSLRKVVTDNFKPIAAVLQGVAEIITRVAKFFLILGGRVGDWIGRIVRWFQTLDATTQTLILAVLGFAAAWRYLNLSFLMTPLGAVITGIITLLALVDDFMTYMEGGESAINWGPWVNDIVSIAGEMSKLLDVMGELWNMVKGPLGEGLRTMFDGAIQTVSGLLGALVHMINYVSALLNGDWDAAWQAALKLAKDLWDIVQGVLKFTGISGAIGAVVDRVTGKGGDAPALAPSPGLATAAATSGGNVELNANTTINVDGAGDPEATGRAVAGQQNRVNSDVVRNMRGAAR